jgi:hypothetical protein
MTNFNYSYIIIPVYIMQSAPPSAPNASPRQPPTSWDNLARENYLLCDLWLQGRCNREACYYAHHPDALVPHELDKFFKKKMCKNLTNEDCPYHLGCNFIHLFDRIIEEDNLTVACTLINNTLIPYRKGYRKE